MQGVDCVRAPIIYNTDCPRPSSQHIPKNRRIIPEIVGCHHSVRGQGRGLQMVTEPIGRLRNAMVCNRVGNFCASASRVVDWRGVDTIGIFKSPSHGSPSRLVSSVLGRRQEAIGIASVSRVGGRGRSMSGASGKSPI